MKAFSLIIILCACFPLYGEQAPYSSKEEKGVLKQAFEIIQVFFPANSVCVSDSIYDKEMAFGGVGLSEEITQVLFGYRPSKGFRYDLPHPCKNIVKALGPEACNWIGKKYVVEFSAPYKNMIYCEILPVDRMIGILGCPTITGFLFKYDEDGISLITRCIINVD